MEDDDFIDFNGSDDPHDFLGTDRRASDEEIDKAFNDIIEGADEETYWTAVRAREYARAGTSTAIPVYKILREDTEPEDISSILDAQSLLNVASPPKSEAQRRGMYSRSSNEIKDRLREISKGDNFEVTKSNIQAVDVACYVLRYRSVEEGKRHVLGPDWDSKDADDKKSDRSESKTLHLGWKYSIYDGDMNEYYVNKDKNVFIRIKNIDKKYKLEYTLINSGEKFTKEFHRYGEAHRKIKQWILDPPT